MHRTTMMVSDELSARLRFEASRRGVSVAQVAREVLEAGLLRSGGAGHLGFFAVAEGCTDDASEHVDELAAGAIARRRDRDDQGR